MKITKKIEISPAEISDIIKKHIGDDSVIVRFKSSIGSRKSGYCGDNGQLYSDIAVFDGVEINIVETYD